MNYSNSGADARRPSRRSKLRLLLTTAETERLDRAVAESGAWCRGLLIVEALRAGLTEPELKLDSRRRLRRIDTFAPESLVVSLKKLAAANGVSRQHLLRHFLFQYLTAAPWKLGERQIVEVARCN